MWEKKKVRITSPSSLAATLIVTLHDLILSVAILGTLLGPDDPVIVIEPHKTHPSINVDNLPAELRACAPEDLCLWVRSKLRAQHSLTSLHRYHQLLAVLCFRWSCPAIKFS